MKGALVTWRGRAETLLISRALGHKFRVLPARWFGIEARQCACHPGQWEFFWNDHQIGALDLMATRPPVVGFRLDYPFGPDDESDERPTKCLEVWPEDAERLRAQIDYWLEHGKVYEPGILTSLLRISSPASGESSPGAQI